MIPPVITRVRSSLLPSLNALQSRVDESIRNFCTNQSPQYAYLSRIKTAESLSEKLETGRFAKLIDIDDLFACTVVVPALSHEKNVADFVGNTFDVVESRRRGTTKKPPDQFRFDATRVICRLAAPPGGLPDEDFSVLKFEVQIKTAFEHAWSAATHSLTYKSGEIDWKLLRLAAQMKANVEQLDQIVLSFEASSEYINEHEWPEIQAKKLIIDEFKELVSSGSVREEMAPKDWSRFAESLYSLLKTSKAFDRYRVVKSTRSLIVVLKEGLSVESDGYLSISLLQLVFGILVREGSIASPLQIQPKKSVYYPVITSELLSLFPQLSDFSPVVDLSLATRKQNDADADPPPGTF